MSYREEYEYHLMNCSTGRLTYSCKTSEEAIKKARYYAEMGGIRYVVLQQVAAVYPVKSIHVEES